MEEIFGPGGLIARAHPEYEYRPGQIQMAEAVLRAFEKKHHLIVEAGTGTGKTLAYLVPAVAAAVSGGRVIISTGTKNLQEQLMGKDIPFLQSILPRKFKAAYMKGRGNYACLNRIKRAESAPVLEGLTELDYFDEVRRWARESETGDRAELTSLPENLSFWRYLDARSETCLGQKCPDFDPCFITRMRQRASEADIVIVNHHLFFADLALRGGEYGRVLPDYAAVIFDEAHLIEDVASEYFGSQVSNHQIDDLLRDLQVLPITSVEKSRALARSAARVARFADQFWLGLREGRGEEGRFSLLPGTFARKTRSGEIEATAQGQVYLSLDGALSSIETTLDTIGDPPPEIENALRRVRELRFNLQFIVAGDDKRFVYWVERRGRGIFLKASPIEVSGILSEKLFEKVAPVILTSATLSSAGNFNFIQERLGLCEAETLVAPSSFDYTEQAVMYLPPHLPDPRAPQWAEAAAEEIIKILQITEGRAFVLSTSVAGMGALYDLVAPRVSFPCLLQGEASRTALLDRFRTTPHAVLFATASFWQGVDVRGPALSCVIIDKLPFAVPSDPVVAARQRDIDDRGGSSFYEYSIPQAIIALKQGLGRLIRSSSDRGLLAILDPRLRTKGYGRQFIHSLPPCRITSNIEEIREVFNNQFRVQSPGLTNSGSRSDFEL
jgi:ATP-dependent DNA helicase DinG